MHEDHHEFNASLGYIAQKQLRIYREFVSNNQVNKKLDIHSQLLK